MLRYSIRDEFEGDSSEAHPDAQLSEERAGEILQPIGFNGRFVVIIVHVVSILSINLDSINSS